MVCIQKKIQVYKIARKFQKANNADEVSFERESHYKRSDQEKTADFVKLKVKTDAYSACIMGKLAKKIGVTRRYTKILVINPFF